MSKADTSEFSDKDLRELHAFLQTAALHAYPNPERIGCPGTAVLEEIARTEYPTDHAGYKHVAKCSPCLKEMLELRERVDERSAARKSRLVFLGVAAAAAIFLILMVSQFWRKPPRAPETASSGNRQGGAIIVGVLDFRDVLGRRGASEQSTPDKPQDLTKAVNELQIILPSGSDVGDYVIEISRDVRMSERVATYSGKASLDVSGTPKLQTKVNFSSLNKGPYVLKWQRKGSDLSGTGSFFIK